MGLDHMFTEEHREKEETKPLNYFLPLEMAQIHFQMGTQTKNRNNGISIKPNLTPFAAFPTLC